MKFSKGNNYIKYLKSLSQSSRILDRTLLIWLQNDYIIWLGTLIERLKYYRLVGSNWTVVEERELWLLWE